MSDHAAMLKYADDAREGSRQLNALSYPERQAVLRAVAAALQEHQDEILEANAKDTAVAKETHLAAPLLKRLELTAGKIATLVDGIRSIADTENPIGRVLSAKELDDNLLLVKQTASIGVLLIVFESRPDSMPQIAALALSSGNGLLLKGGREAEHSNAVIHRVIVDAVTAASAGKVERSVIGLITNRSDVYELLKLEGHIDLVIPRGGNAMVQNIQRSTNIAVLGHADGICHVYAHEDADVAQLIAIATDAKLNYPAACNAAETLLLHRALLTAPHAGGGTVAQHVVQAMTQAGVKFLAGPAALAAGLASTAADSLHVEYGDEHMTVEVVGSLEAAIQHINQHGSHHTDCIVTRAPGAAAAFQAAVDSACVFHNSSTRFADGYRFGLGAEVGISTARVHARGPVGVEGLLTQKWVLYPRDAVDGFATVGQFQGGDRQFSHVDITAKVQAARRGH
ncbi:glutamate-5-semialdehyde dehydrogenase [Strigomonas culicis]|uniref:glutamate-5-semialdehyde dehydrogenase n=2 Tax=Strigomonas culicis TaxID=28005 RepID=S9VXL3_9TRYP|nr:glutamate-5-semialdehyde dehydrogenase [Strigomonas culicis]EPY31272.1 glutamate-5-semialdehyde dehydrogenase [Strigomonas culicis]|eukprot:EPY28380.1 glutamate-5-semialdehyde dehydrogenase [Strigomonas culicis]